MKSVMAICCMHCFLCCISQAPVHYQFTPNNGLPSNEVYEVTADSLGYLWFGTDRGVARFDGRNFKIYTVNDGLNDNVVDRIIVSPSGKIWVLTKNKYLQVLQNERFQPYRYMHQLKEMLNHHRNCEIQYIRFEQEEPVSFSTTHVGVIRPGPDKQFMHTTDTISRLDVQPGLNTVSFYYKQPGPEYRKKMGRKVEFLFYGNSYMTSGEPINLSSPLQKRNGDQLIHFDRWIFVLRNGMLKEAIELEFPVLNVYQDRDYNIWLCSYYNGAKKFAENEPISSATGKTYFSSYAITDLTQDYEGGYWFTTYEGGVFYVPDIDIESIDLRLALPGEYPKEITGNGKNDIYIATSHERLIVLENDSEKNIVSLKPHHDATSRSVCNDLYYDVWSKKILVACSIGLYFIDANSYHVKSFGGGGRGISMAGDRFYIASSGGVGEHSFITKRKNFFLPYPFEFFTAYTDHNDHVWTGSDQGVFLYDGKCLRAIFPEEINIRVNSIKQLANGIMVFASLGKGIFLAIGQTIKQISLGATVQQNMVNDLAIVHNTVWAATERGVVKIGLEDPWNPVIHTWSSANGFPYNGVKKIYAQNGKIYLIAQNKLLIIHERSAPENKYPPPVFLNKIVVQDHTTLSPDSAYTFHHTDHRVKFYFHGINFRSGEYLRYQYRLSGLDDKWHTITEPFVEFSSLSYGTYRFEVVALNENNIPSAMPATYTFTIPSPFWYQWWFITAVCIFVFGWTGLMIRWWFNRERKRNREREAMLQYEQQALSAQINPHFIFNAMTSIQNFILQEDKKSAIKYLTRFSRLMRMNLDNARMKWIQPEAELQLLETYLELENLRYKNKFMYAIHSDQDAMMQQILIPSMLIQPFVENAILHGVNRLEDRQGEIVIRLRYKNDILICEIEDNGIGREKAMNLRTAHSGVHKSAGLNITRERLKLLWTETRKKKLFVIIYNKNQNAEPGGTIVIFSLPFKQMDADA